MPLYFFNIVDADTGCNPDAIELENFDVAKIEAVKLAGALIAESPDSLIHGAGVRVEITDERGFATFTVMGFAVSSIGPGHERESPAG